MFRLHFPEWARPDGCCSLFGVCIRGAKNVRHKHAKVLLMTVACLVILVVGCSRVYLGVQYPSDVLGGILLGIFWALLLEGAMRKPGENQMIP